MRLMVCAAAVAWLVHATNWQDFKRAVQSADRGLVLLSILAFAPAPVLIAVRLKWLLAVHDIHLTVWQAVKVTFAGNFVISAFPVGTPGGDAVKAFYVARGTSQKHEAITTVFFDRLIGVVGLILMSGLVALLNWHNPAFEKWGRIIALMAIVFFAGAGVYFSRRLRAILYLDQIIARLPFASHLQRLDRAMFAFRNHRRTLVACVLLTLVLQGISIVSIYFGGWAVHLVGDAPLRALPIYFAYIPICFIGGVLPLGAMEVMYAEFFSPRLGTAGAALALSILSRFIQLVWALPGALVVLKGGTYREVRKVIDAPDVAGGPIQAASLGSHPPVS